MSFDDLCDSRIMRLSGCDECKLEDDSAYVICFVLDGKTYCASEYVIVDDFSSGSCLDGIVESNHVVENTFDPIEVVCKHIEIDDNNGAWDFYEIWPVVGDEYLIMVGTKNAGLFPTFISCCNV